MGFGVVGVMVIVLCFALALTGEEPEDLELGKREKRGGGGSRKEGKNSSIVIG